MGNAVFGWDNHLLAASLSAGSEASAELGVTNLQSEHGDPASSWQTAAGVLTPQAGAWFVGDTGIATSRWRAFCLARANLTSSARVRWRVGGLDSIVERAPAVLLDFPPGFSLPGGASFTRNTKAWAFNADGVLTEFAANVPREGYHPVTLAYLGYIFEPQARTNVNPNPRAEGAAAGTPGTLPTGWVSATTANSLSRQIVGTGTEDGIPYVDIRYSGTPDATSNLVIAFSGNVGTAAVGETWTRSVFLRLVGGAKDGLRQLTHILREHNGTSIVATEDSAPIDVTDAPLRTQRIVHTRTLTQPDVTLLQAGIRLAYTQNVPLDITLRVGAPQLELGGHASLPILPNVGVQAASTRAADVLTWAPGGNYRNPGEGGSLFAEFTVLAAGSGSGSADVRLDNGTNTNRLNLRYTPSAGAVDGVLFETSTLMGDLSNIAVPIGETIRSVMSWDDTTFTGATQGRAHNVVNPAAVPLAFTRIALLNSAAAATLGVRRVAIYLPKLGAASQLQISTDGSTVDGLAAYDSGWLEDGVAGAAAQRVHVAPTEVVGQYVRCDIDDPSNPDGFVRVALAYAGPAWQPRFNIHPETVFVPERVAREARTRGGQTWYELLWAERAWEVSHQWTEDADVWAQLLAMEQAASLGRNILFIPFPDSADANREAVFGPMRLLAPVGFIAPGTKLRTWRARFVERL
jgi:hypothetical protein